MILDGFEVRVVESLVGAKEAVCSGSVLYVSPAMYDLLRHANVRDLQHLARSIRVLHFPSPPSPFRDSGFQC